MALLLICAVLFGVSLSAAAGFESKLNEPQGGVLAVAHRGETTAHVPNTSDAVLAAADAGADLISVALTKTADNAFVLLADGQKALVNETQTLLQMQTALYGGFSAQKVTELTDVCEALSGRAGLIADFETEDLDALCAYLRENGLTELVLPRVFLPQKEIVRFAQANPDIRLLGVYRGNVVMNANAFLKELSEAGLPLVQYQNKNYFCVSFQVFTTGRFSVGGNGRAMVNMTQPDLCGRREDSITGWDDMISRGFSAVETGDISGLCAYLARSEEMLPGLRSALDAAQAQPLDSLSAQSVKALEAAIAAGEAALESNAALSVRQSALSALQNAVSFAVPAGENETRKGALQITTGKVLTVLFFAVLVFAVQVYMHKKQDQKGEDHHAKKKHH